MAYRGKFQPRNPAKYRGNSSNIVYRSLWELRFFKEIDEHPDVLEWSSEEVVVPYVSPIDSRIHRYFPDVVMKNRLPDGTIETVMVEIKPAAQTKQPNIANRNKTPTGRVSRRYLKEVKTYGINEAKWNAAEKYCAYRGWKFKILTERELFGKGA